MTTPHMNSVEKSLLMRFWPFLELTRSQDVDAVNCQMNETKLLNG